MRFFIYVLFKDKIPIYVGMTRDLEARLKFHRRSKSKGKDFDSYFLANTIYTYNKREAESCEQTLISFVRLINPDSINKYCFAVKSQIKPY